MSIIVEIINIIADSQKELNTIKYTHDASNSQSTLDEITNRVFEELLVGKGSSKYHYNDGSCKVIKLIYLFKFNNACLNSNEEF